MFLSECLVYICSFLFEAKILNFRDHINFSHRLHLDLSGYGSNHRQQKKQRSTVKHTIGSEKDCDNDEGKNRKKDVCDVDAVYEVDNEDSGMEIYLRKGKGVLDQLEMSGLHKDMDK